jgi:hypothetical protein
MGRTTLALLVLQQLLLKQTKKNLESATLQHFQDFSWFEHKVQ